MYLKSIELHGFKSFAHKIVLEFHNGITGIVGPNGSGKSNVADAVRWVLGEQSAKQLRGASMQDVIFAGTQNRKPVSFAYVAITMDNSDHLLPVDYEEVTVARRVYRSGESEYLLNGTSCRLKDVNELFFDTGIGKEGYSIIGQGQVEKIISGKPEERRELFDEAVGIVKFKKRKATAIKKLEAQQDNLTRVNDILAELTARVGPLEEQSRVAKDYLKKKEELKTLDVNMFLMEIERLRGELSGIEKNLSISRDQLDKAKADDEKIKGEYAALEEQLGHMEEKINSIRDQQNDTVLKKGNLENEIKILQEQIHFAENSDEGIAMRKGVLLAERQEHIRQRDDFSTEKEKLTAMLTEASDRLARAREYWQNIENEINSCNAGIEKNQQEIMRLLNEKATIKSEEQRMSTMYEQTNIRKARLTQRILARKTEEDSLSASCETAQKTFDEATKALSEIRKKESEKTAEIEKWQKRLREVSEENNRLGRDITARQSRLDSLKSIAERYEGYGNSTKKVMEKKSDTPGLHGVVADLIHVEKKFETAIETALGGNIQNIVTEDEDTAKEMIAYLKENHFGRATFLPLTAVDGRGNFKKKEVLSERGVIGLCDEVIDCDEIYRGIVAYLVGRVVLCDTIDNAIALARRNHYSLHIVTLEGEYLSPGGSMAGGSFKHKGNLLSRNRQIDQLEKELTELTKKQAECKKKYDEIETALELSREDIKEIRQTVSTLALEENTAKLGLERATSEKADSARAAETLKEESKEIESQLLRIDSDKKKIVDQLQEADEREKVLKKEIEDFQEKLDQQTYMEQTASRQMSEVQIEEANARQKVTFVEENLTRVSSEIEKDDNNLLNLENESKNTKVEAEKKKQAIDEISATIAAADESYKKLEEELSEAKQTREKMNETFKGFFDKKEEISKLITGLEKEIYRLESGQERARDAMEYQNNYMWDEYELTLHAAMELRNESYNNRDEMKKSISAIRDAIRKMGNVNVGAIEEYKEVSERYEFLKTQHDDIVEASEKLSEIIDELDRGMREQFARGFEDIRREFDKAFKELFGGGKGELELVEGEDILETGIKIIAQPPGKKLQNMMQLSGGEKSLTAIALLFAIQNLKPSPFCLLDEIEAALDDSNVDRFAKYLNRLTKNTQFIVITHRRGTMTAADRLYGITMQEKGVSTLVSVNLIENDLEE